MPVLARLAVPCVSTARSTTRRPLAEQAQTVTMTETSSSPPSHRDDEPGGGRWPFLRDVLVLQLKLLIGNVHNFILMPATMGAAGLDLLFKSGRHGSGFYRVLDWGRRAEEAIGLYSALDREDRELKADFTVDAVVARVESAIMREVEKGGTAASVKSAVDLALDQLHLEADRRTSRARETAQRMIEKLSQPASKNEP